MKHLALYGGSFNPPHLGHVWVMATVLSQLEVDALWMIPTYKHRWGKVLLNFEQRLELCQKAAEIFGHRVYVSDLERQLGGESRTIRLVDALLKRHESLQITLIVGSDLREEIHHWAEFERLNILVQWFFIDREGFSRTQPYALPNISSSRLRQALENGERALCEAWLPHKVWETIQSKGYYIKPKTQE